jgi:hypothetical protein
MKYFFILFLPLYRFPLQPQNAPGASCCREIPRRQTDGGRSSLAPTVVPVIPYRREDTTVIVIDIFLIVTTARRQPHLTSFMPGRRTPI